MLSKFKSLPGPALNRLAAVELLFFIYGAKLNE